MKGLEETMRHFKSIESLRAYMAWWVVIGHGLHLSGYTFEVYDTGPIHYLLRILQRGATAVNTFIIVSGFVILHLVLSKKESYRGYIIRRGMRIFPIFLIALALAMLLQPLYIEAYTQYAWVKAREMRLERVAVEHEYFFEHLFLHLTMLHGLVPEECLRFASGTFLAPAWSISLEWQFYIIAPFLFSAFLSKSVLYRYSVAVICFMLVAGFHLQTAFTWAYPSMLVLSLPHFFVGIGSRMFLSDDRKTRLFGLVLAVVSLPFTDYLAIIIWAFFFIIVLAESDRIALPSIVKRLFALVGWGRFTTYLGKMSYSTYLLHIPLFSFVVGGAGLLSEGKMSQELAGLLIVICSLLMIPISHFAYNGIEAPLSRMGSRIARRFNPTKPLQATEIVTPSR